VSFHTSPQIPQKTVKGPKSGGKYSNIPLSRQVNIYTPQNTSNTSTVYPHFQGCHNKGTKVKSPKSQNQRILGSKSDVVAVALRPRSAHSLTSLHPKKNPTQGSVSPDKTPALSTVILCAWHSYSGPPARVSRFVTASLHTRRPEWVVHGQSKGT